jgi:hypothetical protein
VAITVIATGFDGKRHGSSSRASALAGTDAAAKAPRDFLEELERQRSQMNDTGVPDAPAARVEAGSLVGSGNGNGASTGGTVEPVPVRRPSYDADDLEIPSFLRRSR